MTRIGRYEVESEIGRGAMGVVYLAHDPRLKRRVAVKTHALPQGLTEEQKTEFRLRFLREAHAAAVLSHSGIVTIYDADDDNGLPFIAMEYVEGRSLRQLLDDQTQLDPDRAVEMAGAMAEALHAAHDAGIVHRDIKPANLLIRERDGAVKVADFGVARVTTSELTQSGTSLGTPAYMSPEQIEGRKVDGRSDLFSLAVILYEALCGERPFGGDNVTAVIYSVTRETPIPISKRVEGLPRGMDTFFDRALSKDADGRFPDGASFKEALVAALRDDTPVEVESTVSVATSIQSIPPAPTASSPATERTDDWSGGRYAAPPHAFDSDGRPWWQRRAMLATIVIFLVIGGWALLGGNETAYLELEGKSAVESGKLTLLVDGEKVYSRRLSAPQKSKGLIKKFLDQNQETFEKRIKIDPGKHKITAHVLPKGASAPYRESVVFAIEPGETRRLKLVAGRSIGSSLSLKVN
jgi:serine/threonine protein kinase